MKQSTKRLAQKQTTRPTHVYFLTDLHRDLANNDQCKSDEATTELKAELSDGDFADATLADFDCIFFCNVQQPPMNGRTTSRFTSKAARSCSPWRPRSSRTTTTNLFISTFRRKLVRRPHRFLNRQTSRQPMRPFLPARIGGRANDQFGVDPLATVPHHHTVPRPGASDRPTHHPISRFKDSNPRKRSRRNRRCQRCRWRTHSS